jgi:cysteinyl-tRNA synthetase
VVVGAGPAVRAPARAGKALVKEFNAALEDDLDTPRAIRALRRAVRERDPAAAKWMLGVLVGSASLT